MKLKVVEIQTARGVIKAPTMNIGKNGNFSFTPLSIERMNAKHGDLFAYIQDEENPKKWYVMVSEKLGSLKLKIKGEGKGGVFSSSDLRDQIFKSFNHSKDSALKFNIGMATDWEGHKIYPLNLIPSTLKPVKQNP
jgi:hypothetical protein